MTKDNKHIKSTGKTISKKDKRKAEINYKKKQNRGDSDSSDLDDSSSDENEEVDMDETEYRKFLSKIFPSKNLDKKIKAGEKLKKTIKNESKSKSKSTSKYESDTSDDDYISSSSEEEEDDDEDDEEDEEEDEEDEEEESIKDKKGKKGKKNEKVNIIFTIGGDVEDDYYEDDDESWEDLSDEETEDEDESVSSASDDDEDEEEEEKEKEKEKKDKKNKNKSKKENKKENKKNKDESKDEDEVKDENEEKGEVKDEDNVKDEVKDDEFLTKLKELHKNNKNNHSIQKCINVYKNDLVLSKKKSAKKEKKQKAKNERIYRRIVHDKNTMNDYTFFEKLELCAQKKIIKELREINKISRIEKPYRMTILESNIPPQFKAEAMKKINSLRYMEQGSGEYYKIKNWVDTFMRIPFNKYNTLPINITDGVEKCHDFMDNAKQILDAAVYGLNDAKMQIMQMLGLLITNPKAIGTSIAINGPPGTGKTSLIKEGISKILDRPFAFIALGGATDSSFLEGHSYTYEGSVWGKLVQILIDSQCMNPVIYFDELDKISDTPKGEEIAGILTHLTDTTQNSQFHDKYFAEVDFDFSKCLFIFSYNDESKINPILKDRMYRIQTKGYDKKQKTIISNQYLLPKICELVCFKTEDITIPDETLHYIIENFCNKEDGVRNLKRCLEIIYTKLNLYRLMKSGSNLFEEDMSIKVEFPYTVTNSIVQKLIKKEDERLSAMYSMYV